MVEQLQCLLVKSEYNVDKTAKLIQGFTQGFGIGDRGSKKKRDMAKNLSIDPDIGSEVDLWNKVMKEVKLGRYAGPFAKEELPFRYFIQSPIGLVPEAGGQARLIFHLSYNFKNGNKSVNECMPKEICMVKYRNLDDTVKNCLKLLEQVNDQITMNMTGGIFYSKCDLKLAFRILPLLVQD